MTGLDHYRKAEELTERLTSTSGKGTGRGAPLSGPPSPRFTPPSLLLRPARSGRRPLKAAPGPTSLAPSSRQAAPSAATATVCALGWSAPPIPGTQPTRDLYSERTTFWQAGCQLQELRRWQAHRDPKSSKGHLNLDDRVPLACTFSLLGQSPGTCFEVAPERI